MSLDGIETSLRQNLPAELHSVVPALAQLLVELDSGATTPAAAQRRLAADLRLSTALHSLASQQVEIANKLISFDGAQTGDITFGNIAGRDIIYQAKLTPEERLERRNRAALLELVRRLWIEGVLHQSLHQQVFIELGMQTRPDVIEHPWQTLIRLPDSEPHPLDPSQPLLQVFKNAGERLLILGAPGSGKTTTLLVLAEALINEAIADEERPIPVIFPLSTWAVNQPPLDQWLIEELAQRYKVPPKVGKAWVERGEVLPLLDGLDEVGPTDAERATCVGAINAYLAGQGGQAVVCSRIAEYERQGARFQVETAVEIQLLTSPQIGYYLERLGSSLIGLRVAVAQDEVLSDLAASPLLLSVMALTYCDLPAEVLIGQAREDADQRLWAGYVRQRLQLPRADTSTDPKQLEAWLTWLARGMQFHGQQVFYIEYLQPSWLATKGQRRLFRGISIFVGGLVGALVVGLIFGLVGGLVVGLIIGLIFGLILGLNFDDTSIRLTETLSWDWRLIPNWQSFRREIGYSLFVGGLFGLSVGIVGSLIFGFSVGLGYSLIFGLSAGLGYGLGYSPVWSMLNGDEIQLSTRPNEGIQRSQRSMIIGGLLSGLLGCLAGSLGGGLGYTLFCALGGDFVSILGDSLVGIMGVGMGFGLIFSLGGGLDYGGSAVTKHFLLRFFLHRLCGAPWNFAAFLDQAVSRGFMTRVGGGYRFYHRLLQEHFANHEETTLPVAPILGPQNGDKTGGRRSE